jgi:putative oxidoreductase
MLHKRFHIPISIDFAVLILRVIPSLFMMGHGWSKLSNLLKGDWSFADPMGIGEPISLLLTIFAELVCSFLVIIGLFTRPALVILMVLCTIIIFIIHGADPIGDKEHAALFFVIYAAVFITGPGRFSVDDRLFRR